VSPQYMTAMAIHNESIDLGRYSQEDSLRRLFLACESPGVDSRLRHPNTDWQQLFLCYSQMIFNVSDVAHAVLCMRSSSHRIAFW
jgi:hypothetical protein